jgi:hypothetical protein
MGLSATPRLLLLLSAAACLALGVAGGLARLGLSIQAPSAAAFHGAIMISGFLGTVISLERAVALGNRWAYAAPVAAALGTLLPLAGFHTAGIALWLAAPLLLLGSSLAIARRQPEAHTILLCVAAGAWGIGNAIYATRFTGAAPAWWFTFLVLTIAAERLEMTRLTRRPAAALPSFLAIVALLLAAACLSLGAGRAGPIAFGAALCALAAWLALYDIARRTVRTQGFARYAAVALLSGYAWLAVAGIAWALGDSRDVALHALGLGFVFSMILAHAPLIVPVVLKRPVRYTAFFYAPLALLHASLLLRFAEPSLRALGGVLNAVALGAFALTLLSALSTRRVT